MSDLERGHTRKPYPRSVRRLVRALGLSEAAGDDVVTGLRVDPDTRVVPQSTTADGRPHAPSHVGSVSGSVVVPWQLPAATAHFTGRVDELDVLHGLARRVLPGGEAGPVVIISAIAGTAGVGKTALAVHWAHQHAHRFPDGQLFVNLRGFGPSAAPVPTATALRIFLDAFAVPPARIPADLDAQIGLYRSLLAGRRVLIVLDNARDAEQVRPLLPGAAGCLVLVTSRDRLTDLVALDGAIPLTVDLLSRPEAGQLLTRRLSPARVAPEPAATEELIDLCARLPLALNIAASRAITHPGLPLGALAAELRDTHRRLDLLSAGTGGANLRAVFSWSYHQLTGSTARMFRLLGVHPGPDISVAAAASLAGTSRGEARRALGELAAAHLLAEQIPGRYGLHDLLRVYAAEHAGTNERTLATHRTLDHYLHTARTATLLLFPAREPVTLPAPHPGTLPEEITDDQQALTWFDAERPTLLAAAALAATARFDAHAWQIPSALAAYLERRGHWYDYAAAQTTALAAAEHARDLPAQANAHCLLGRACGRIGSHTEAHAHLMHALEFYRTLDDPAGQAHTQHSLGWMLGQQSRYHESLHHARQALALYRAAGHRTGEARALNTVGWYGSLLGRHQQALTYCQQALDLHRELGNHDGEADAWDSLGHAHHHLGHYTDAVTCYRRALDLTQRLGDHYQQADILSHLGDTYRAAGDRATAGDAWSQAIAILNDLHRPDADKLRGRLLSLEIPLDTPGLPKSTRRADQ